MSGSKKINVAELCAGDKVKVFHAFYKEPSEEVVEVRSVSKIAPNGDVDGSIWVYYKNEKGNNGAIAGEFVTEVISIYGEGK